MLPVHLLQPFMDLARLCMTWCKAGEPGFHTQTKDWKSGDVFTLELPMEVTFEDYAVRGRSVVLGPLGDEDCVS